MQRQLIEQMALQAAKQTPAKAENQTTLSSDRELLERMVRVEEELNDAGRDNFVPSDVITRLFYFPEWL